MPTTIPLVRRRPDDEIPPPNPGAALLIIWAVAMLLFGAIAAFTPNRTGSDPFDIISIY